MQVACFSSNWPAVETLHPRQLDIFVHGWQDDCPPPDVNGAAPAVTAPAVPGQGVGTSRPLRVGQVVVTRRARRLCEVCKVYADGSASVFYLDTGEPNVGLGHERLPRHCLSVRLNVAPPRL